jgi:hypothetical protein
MDIYDTMLITSLEDNDCIFYSQDYIEVQRFIDGGPSFMVHGVSHLSGDIVDYAIPADAEVGLWRY